MDIGIGTCAERAKSLGASWDDTCSWAGASSVTDGVAEGCSLSRAIGSPRHQGQGELCVSSRDEAHMDVSPRV